MFLSEDNSSGKIYPFSYSTDLSLKSFHSIKVCKTNNLARLQKIRVHYDVLDIPIMIVSTYCLTSPEHLGAAGTRHASWGPRRIRVLTRGTERAIILGKLHKQNYITANIHLIIIEAASLLSRTNLRIKHVSFIFIFWQQSVTASYEKKQNSNPRACPINNQAWKNVPRPQSVLNSTNATSFPAALTPPAIMNDDTPTVSANLV